MEWLELRNTNNYSQDHINNSIDDNDTHSHNKNITNIRNTGINAFYMINTDNEPVFKRIYNPESPLSSNADTFALFLSAVNTFSHQMLVAKLNDIGMFNQRIFIKHITSYNYAQVIDDVIHLTRSKETEKTAINTFFRTFLKNNRNIDLKIPIDKSNKDELGDFTSNVDWYLSDACKHLRPADKKPM